MDEGDVRAWYDDYLRAFEECGRGAAAPGSLLAFYDVPLLVTTDAAAVTLATAGEVVGAFEPQLERMRAEGYDRSEARAIDVSVLNARTALVGGTFDRVRRDGSVISHLVATYLVVDGDAGRRIRAMVLGS